LITIWSTLPHKHPSLGKRAPAAPVRGCASHALLPAARPDLHRHPAPRPPARRSPRPDPCVADAEILPIRHNRAVRVPESGSAHGPSAGPGRAPPGHPAKPASPARTARPAGGPRRAAVAGLAWRGRLRRVGRDYSALSRSGGSSRSMPAAARSMPSCSRASLTTR